MKFDDRKSGMWARSRVTAMIAILASVFSIGVAKAGDIQLFVGGASPRINVVSMAERKFGTVVKQQYDFSCGSAALATLLTHHYGRETSETDAFRSMWDVGDHERIRELGFSLLEMKRYLESVGLKADGFVLTLERIEEIGVPGIALVDVRGYKHFVVIKGITDEVVLIGDPSAGVISLPRNVFEQRWDGTILFIRSDVTRGKANFNKIADWRLAPSAPHDRARDDEPLQSLYINQTRPTYSGFTINTAVEVQ
ncbi:C39 family peptidase [Hyphococcus sp.]|uniref:C39 family peptidase n=1 Tax=Hyphococcus sp. TaxID=2038636 RepID=UPI0037539AA2